jgi:hypothetical protein
MIPRPPLIVLSLLSIGLLSTGSSSIDLLLPTAAAQESGTHALFRCRGSDGVTSFQQTPCADGQLDAGRILYDPVEAPARAGPPVAPATPVPSAVLPVPAESVTEGPSPEIVPTSDSPPVPVATPVVPAPATFSNSPGASEPASDAVECLRPDSSTYIRSGECDRSAIGGEKIEGYVLDKDSGERVWMETVTPLRQIQDPARALTRSEACEMAKLHIDQIRAGKSVGGTFLRDAEGVRDRHCD